MTMERETQIIATLGPASMKEAVLYRMYQKGLNIVRLNFSHGTHEFHQQAIDLIRHLNKKYKADIKILQDLEGYRIRIGELKSPIELKRGQFIFLSKTPPNEEVIPFDFDGDVKRIEKGLKVYIDDGTKCLSVVGHEKNCLKLRVEQGGLLKSRKGINIPGLRLCDDIMTEKDKRDIKFGIANNVDIIAQSFVRNKDDIFEVVSRVKPHLPQCQIIAKIENEEGVKNIDEILHTCDGIMIARGDMGVSLPVYKVPIIQKYICRQCNAHKKYVIVATQMLESMIENSRPTRAEVSDVANAILDNADAVMLSGETAVGKHPVLTVDMMCKIIVYVEKSLALRI